ncbi:MAG TPA: L-aspartate oxidase [Mycobacteriales bacterium]|nr:L-aspartate oxidase [Mycobacteriales bacterium]
MTGARADGLYDVVVIGSGVAGLATALGLAGVRRVALVTSGELRGGSTTWAQGGLAAALGEDDSASLHAVDTVTAGSDFGDPATIQILTGSAVEAVCDLLRRGARLDRDGFGRIALTREGGHSQRRVAHAGGDASGAEVSRSLATAVRQHDVDILEHTEARDLLTVGRGLDRAVRGVVAVGPDGSEQVLSAAAVVIATGGIGGLFTTSTNPAEVTGAGLGLALRAGATLTDLEFVQFHPTALDTGGGAGQVPLITEALRGEGAVLRDGRGRPVMAGRHPLGDLAPRDVVARRVAEVRAAAGRVYLDATSVDDLTSRFPTVVAACAAHGIDPSAVPIPVAPAQHFSCGGIRTDEWGATDVRGLFAVGEAAATGVHGANRLASNSLVEGLVFGARLAARLCLSLPLTTSQPDTLTPRPAVNRARLDGIRLLLSDDAGIRRDGAALADAADRLASMPSAQGVDDADSVGDQWLAASAVVAAASTRRESRGCHWRDDHPAASEWWHRHRVLTSLGADGLPVTTVEPIARSRPALERTA